MRTDDLVGIPYADLDCVGIVLLIRAKLGRPIEAPWSRDVEEVTHEWPLASRPYVVGDILLLKSQGVADHCAVVVADGLAVHTTEATGSCSVRVSALERAGIIKGAWRP